MNQELRIEQVGEEHIEPYVRLSRAEYGDAAAVSQANHLRWKFIENPQGPSLGLHVYCGEQMIGRMVAMPRDVIYQNKVYRAAYMADLVVDRAHRGMMPLLLLMQGVKQLSGFDLVLITPNAAGTVVWEKLAKMSPQFELGVAAVPFCPASASGKTGRLRMGALAAPVDWIFRSLTGGLSRLGALFFRAEVQNTWPDAVELESLLEHSREQEFGAGLRSRAFLEWRFRQSPVFQYDAWFIRENGELAGYLVTRHAQYEGLDCRFIVDVFGRHDSVDRLWRSVQLGVLRRAAQEKVEIAMSIGNDQCKPFSLISRFPFLRIPPGLLPRRIALYGQWISQPHFSFAPKNFYLTLADCDMV